MIRSYKTIDAHVGGQTLRLIVDGMPHIAGKSLLQKRAWLRKHFDAARRAVVLEPRGHADMYGALLTEHQREVIDLYLRSDWSLAEIASHQGTSRAAVHDLLRRSTISLLDYEKRLGLLLLAPHGVSWSPRSAVSVCAWHMLAVGASIDDGPRHATQRL